MNKVPPTIQAIEASCCVTVPNKRKNRIYSTWMWVLTFLTYCSYHMSRKPISVVKNVLNQNCSNMTPPVETNNTHWCDWAPFDTEDSATLLGTVDSAFLFTYAAAMFISGFVAERMDLRLFLSVGMILSGCFCAMFGLGYSFKIHMLWYYILAQILSGFVSATGWPGVVTALGNWFGKSKRGLIFGIWNIHTSLGNIVGTLIAASFVTYNWALSFIVPGIIIASLGIIVFFFMVPEPSYIGLPNPNAKIMHQRCSPMPQRRYQPAYDTETQEEHACLLDDDEIQTSYVDKDKEVEARQRTERLDEEKAIGFLQALFIPGVVEFSLCLFFAKLVSYTFLYWLPNYIYHSTTFDAEGSANLSTFFDVGAMIGGVLAGIISDYSGMSATTCTVLLIFAIPMMEVYRLYAGGSSYAKTMGLLVLMGTVVNAPYALITTAISADLGTHPILAGSARAVATVSAIIDGTGSIGAAVGPLIAGPLSAANWNYVFYMLMVSDVIAMLLLTRLVVREVKGRLQQYRQRSHSRF